MWGIVWLYEHRHRPTLVRVTCAKVLEKTAAEDQRDGGIRVPMSRDPRMRAMRRLRET